MTTFYTNLMRIMRIKIYVHMYCLFYKILFAFVAYDIHASSNSEHNGNELGGWFRESMYKQFTFKWHFAKRELINFYKLS